MLFDDRLISHAAILKYLYFVYARSLFREIFVCRQMRLALEGNASAVRAGR